MTTFDKKAISTEKQLELLIRRGMNVSDRGRALHFLTHINYYRLRAYWQPFEVSGANDHVFAKGADFQSVLALYDFDRELRLLLIDAIERVEISVRTRLAQVLSHRYGPFAHQVQSHLKTSQSWQHLNRLLLNHYKRSKHMFAIQYRQLYTKYNTTSIWVVCEMISLGQLSRWIYDLRVPKDRQSISDIYSLDEKVFASFAHHLTLVRNHCAHHERIWNRNLRVIMKIPKQKPEELMSQFNTNNRGSIYNTLTMLSYLMSIISPNSSWRKRLKDLIFASPHINPKDMGFPTGWEQFPLWQVQTRCV